MIHVGDPLFTARRIIGFFSAAPGRQRHRRKDGRHVLLDVAFATAQLWTQPACTPVWTVARVDDASR
jgi:hypothetical protein